jgi:hypothetical protein
MVRTVSGSRQITSDGTLVSEPTPLSISDVQRTKSAPERAVLRLLFLGQWGVLPEVLDVYNQDVVTELGGTRLAEAYGWLRPQLASAAPEIKGTVRKGGHAYVTVELFRQGSPPQGESFDLENADGKWRVVFDTLLARGLAEYRQYQMAPNPAQPDPQAIRAGERAADAYRRISAAGHAQ